MKISELVKLIDGEILVGADKVDTEICSAGASDMMSDVLAYFSDQDVIITGLANPQVVRTAEMMDASCIVLTRGKVPDAIMLELASRKEMIFICTQKGIFETSGLLFCAGLNI